MDTETEEKPREKSCIGEVVLLAAVVAPLVVASNVYTAHNDLPCDVPLPAWILIGMALGVSFVASRFKILRFMVPLRYMRLACFLLRAMLCGTLKDKPESQRQAKKQSYGCDRCFWFVSTIFAIVWFVQINVLVWEAEPLANASAYSNTTMVGADALDPLPIAARPPLNPTPARPPAPPPSPSPLLPDPFGNRPPPPSPPPLLPDIGRRLQMPGDRWQKVWDDLQTAYGDGNIPSGEGCHPDLLQGARHTLMTVYIAGSTWLIFVCCSCCYRTCSSDEEDELEREFDVWKAMERAEKPGAHEARASKKSAACTAKNAKGSRDQKSSTVAAAANEPAVLAVQQQESAAGEAERSFMANIAEEASGCDAQAATILEAVDPPPLATTATGTEMCDANTRSTAKEPEAFDRTKQRKLRLAEIRAKRKEREMRLSAREHGTRDVPYSWRHLEPTGVMLRANDQVVYPKPAYGFVSHAEWSPETPFVSYEEAQSLVQTRHTNGAAHPSLVAEQLRFDREITPSATNALVRHGLQGFAVSGAGSKEANGFYARKGEYEGAALFIKGQWWLLRYTLPSGNWWYIADKNQLDRDHGDLYRAQSDSDLPPLDGWVKAHDGQLPVPQLSAVDDGNETVGTSTAARAPQSDDDDFINALKDLDEAELNNALQAHGIDNTGYNSDEKIHVLAAAMMA